MRIAQLAPLYEAVPPKLYGGTERVVSYLTEELVAMGHDVTLFASGDSRTAARLEAPNERSLRLDESVRDVMAPHIVMIERLAASADRFDVIHNHLDYLPFGALRRQATPFVTTLHGRLDLPELQMIYDTFSVPIVSISDSQRRPVPQANFVRTIHHGLPERLLTPRPVEPTYLAFLGRICPEKQPDRAINIATTAGLKLRMAAKVDKVDREYFRDEIKPRIDGERVELVGEIDETQKPDFLSGAKALLLPIDWPEPFGLVMIEAMACGCPVIAYPSGSVPEVIEDGLTGFIVRDEAGAVDAVQRLGSLDRTRIRRRFEERFTARRMAENYLDIYRALGAADRPPLRAVG